MDVFSGAAEISENNDECWVQAVRCISSTVVQALFSEVQNNVNVQP